MASDNLDYIPGDLESIKFAYLRKPYLEGLEAIKNLGYATEDYIHNFPCFAGTLTLARYLSLVECYKKSLNLAGHIAEIGVYKGACSLLFAKLSQIYEPYTLTQVHGFDWFKGTAELTEEEKSHLIEGSYNETQERIEQLIKAQRLDHIIKIHNMDMSSGSLDEFFSLYPHLQFKLVFFDCGRYEVMIKSLPLFWERLTKGGIIVFDQYNFELAPGETRAVREILPDVVIHSFPQGWLPNAYIQK